MPSEPERQQIGIRLSAETVRKIDAVRGGQTRAEFCRTLIENGLSDKNSATAEVVRNIQESLDSMQEQLLTIHQSATLSQRDASLSVALTERLHSAVATAIAGVLTKIGHVVREGDQREFARKKAEEFVARIFYPDGPATEQ